MEALSTSTETGNRGRADFLTNIELWALDDESCLGPGGVEASWTRMFHIDINWNLDVQFVNGHFNISDFLLLVQDEWYLYNPNNHVADSCEVYNENARSFKDVYFHYCEIFWYRKSLLPIA
ncbi:hypothetical protein POM88_007173 [Heracleum sosnowskyi]|uniref:Uncharacterized protein n=1 Tax=Heracleum sosnowskyi TaxID=360622 RepID=A0AAD8J3X7_9APIA|nr:hypothetical protein POM88_007173 [Heracleum sosnowskyi]